MGIKDRIIAMLGGTPPKPLDDEVSHVGAFTAGADSPIVKMMMERRARGETGPLTVSRDSAEGRAIMKELGIGAPVHTGKEPTDVTEIARKALGGDPDGDHIEWAHWLKERASLTDKFPGWIPCRFFNRIGPESAGGVFGAVKGQFGIWESTFGFCDYDADEDDQSMKVLPSLTHLPSGIVIGTFIDAPAAIAASEAAAVLDWSQMPQADPDDTASNAWRIRLSQLHQTWAFYGICKEDRRHAHEQAYGTVVSIFAKRDLAEGKPEKMS